MFWMNGKIHPVLSPHLLLDLYPLPKFSTVTVRRRLLRQSVFSTHKRCRRRRSLFVCATVLVNTVTIDIRRWRLEQSNKRETARDRDGRTQIIAIDDQNISVQRHPTITKRAAPTARAAQRQSYDFIYNLQITLKEYNARGGGGGGRER